MPNCDDFAIRVAYQCSASGYEETTSDRLIGLFFEKSMLSARKTVVRERSSKALVLRQL